MQKFVAFGFGVWLACQMGFAGVTDRGALRAGAARVDITPPANPEYPASGKYAHERLYIRAIVLDNGVTRAALIGADQSGLADDVWAKASRQIAEELSCPVGSQNQIRKAGEAMQQSKAGNGCGFAMSGSRRPAAILPQALADSRPE